MLFVFFKSSATILQITLEKQVHFLHEQIFQVPVSSQCQEMLANASILFCSLNNLPVVWIGQKACILPKAVNFPDSSLQFSGLNFGPYSSPMVGSIASSSPLFSPGPASVSPGGSLSHGSDNFSGGKQKQE